MIDFKKTKINNIMLKALGKLEVLTNRLKVLNVSTKSTKRKIVLSTKNLSIPGLEKGSYFTTEVIDGECIKLRPTELGDKDVRIVSYRTYAKREDYVEPVIDLRHQEKLDRALADATHVRVVYTQSEVTIFPIKDHEQSAINDPKECEMSIGIDEDDIYSGILPAIEKIKSEKYSHITIKSDNSYFNSRENVIFRIQLRRLGYEIGDFLNGVFTAKIPGANKPNKKEIHHFEPPEIVLANNDEAVKGFDFKRPLSTHTVCTGGVDVKCLENEGFENLAVTEYRTIEARDIKKIKCKETGEVIGTTVNDKTDAYALCAVFNSQHTTALFNEDVYKVSFNDIKEYAPKTNFLHWSLCCTDFSSLKTISERERSIELLNTTTDMFIELLEYVKQSCTPSLLVENVKNFSNSVEKKLLVRGLKSLGMNVKDEVLHSRDFNGMSQRERFYLFASKLDSEFDFPKPEARTKNAWRDVVLPNIDKAKIVSHCVSVKKGVETGRIRLIKEGDELSPAIVRSQLRATKDSVYIYHNGEYLLPPVDMLKELMGIDPTFDYSGNTKEESSEILGQGIEFPLHSRICGQVKKHVLSFYDRAKCIKGTTQRLKTTAKKIKPKRTTTAPVAMQLSLDF